MIVRGVTMISLTHPDGTITKFTPGQVEIKQIASEASGEGVEGEPEAALGGVRGSPQGIYWCRFCGQHGWNDNMTCARCWAGSFETSVTVTGVATQELADALTPVIGAALDLTQSLDQATQSLAQTLGRFGSKLKRQVG